MQSWWRVGDAVLSRLRAGERWQHLFAVAYDREAVEEFTISELAEAAGLSPRNIRLYQTRGMLPPPTLRRREAIYGPEHLERLKLIRRLMGEGLSRDAIQRLLAEPGEMMERLVALRNAAIGEEHPGMAVVSVPDLVERFGDNPAHLAEAQRLGLVVSRDDGRFDVPQPGLLAIAEQALQLGLSLQATLEIAAFSEAQVTAAAAFFVAIARRELWDPFDRAGRPDSGWEQVAQGFEGARPLATAVYDLLLPPAIAAEVRRVTGNVLEAG